MLKNDSQVTNPFFRLKAFRLSIISVVVINLAYGQIDRTEQKSQSFLYQVGIVDSIYSEVLEEHREFYIQLPPDYSPEEKQSYPIAFVLDGEVFLPTLNIVQQYYSGGFLPEMVLVGISNSKHRTRDLTPSKVDTLYGMPYDQESGGAEGFMTFLEKELIPYIENRYPVTNFRTLIGHSYGGLFTVYALSMYQGLFANYLAIDPSMDWDDRALLKSLKDRLPSMDLMGKSLFVSLSGQLHMQNPEITIENVMQDTTDFTLFSRSIIALTELVSQNQKSGLAFDWKFYPRELHGTIPMPSIMDGLISLFEWYQMENTDKFNSPDTPAEELGGIVKYRASKLQDHFGYEVPPYPEDLLNVLGYMSMDMGQPDKAKMYFEFGIEYYPNSPNTYDSMADYYERNDDFENALKFVSKAYEISGGNEYYKNRMESLQNN